MAETTFLCKTAALKDPGSRGFSVTHKGVVVEGFIVCKEGHYYAYRNQCPHTGVPLDWVEHQFLDRDDRLIQCATHDARFTIENGVCVAGPCVGEQLLALPLRRDGDDLYLA